MELIDKDALVAEIERLISNGKFQCQQSQEYNDQESYIAWSEHVATCEKMLSFINTIEVKDVDLEKELNDFIEQQNAHIKDDRVVECDNGDSFNHIYDLQEIAKHFFELGMAVNNKAQKGVSVQRTIQYADKVILIAEIDKLQDSIKATAVDGRISKEQAEAYKVCVKLRSFIEDAPEVKEVNLEKETAHYLLHEHRSPLNEIMHKADLNAEMQYHEDIKNAFKAGYDIGMLERNKQRKSRTKEAIQYINKSTLVAYIDKRRDEIKWGIFSIPLTGRDRAFATFEYEILGKTKDFIDTLKAEEVDLEKEIETHLKDCLDVKFPTTDIELIKKDVTYTAKKFFELGLSVNSPITAADRGTAEEIIVNLKRVENDYRIDLTKQMEWLRNIVKKGEKV